MIINLKENRISRAWSCSPRVPQVEEEEEEAYLWTVKHVFLHYCWCYPPRPPPVEGTLPPPLPLTPMSTQEVWTEPISLERVRPMGRKLTLFRPVDFAKISRSS